VAGTVAVVAVEVTIAVVVGSIAAAAFFIGLRVDATAPHEENEAGKQCDEREVSRAHG